MINKLFLGTYFIIGVPYSIGTTERYVPTEIPDSFTAFLIMPPHLPTVEKVLPDVIKRKVHGSQRQKIGVGNPDAHSGVFLSKKLAASNGVAVLFPYPFAKAELEGTITHRGYGQTNYRSPIAFSMQENEIDGLPKSDKQGDRPYIKGAAFETA